MLAINNWNVTSIGISPFFLMYSYDVNLFDLTRGRTKLHTTRNSLVAYREAFVAKLKEVAEVA